MPFHFLPVTCVYAVILNSWKAIFNLSHSQGSNYIRHLEWWNFICNCGWKVEILDFLPPSSVEMRTLQNFNFGQYLRGILSYSHSQISMRQFFLSSSYITTGHCGQNFSSTWPFGGMLWFFKISKFCCYWFICEKFQKIFFK